MRDAGCGMRAGGGSAARARCLTPFHALNHRVAALQVCGCSKVTPGLDEDWLGRIVDDTGDHYLVPDQAVRAHHVGAIAKQNLI